MKANCLKWKREQSANYSSTSNYNRDGAMLAHDVVLLGLDAIELKEKGIYEIKEEDESSLFAPELEIMSMSSEEKTKSSAETGDSKREQDKITSSANTQSSHKEREERPVDGRTVQVPQQESEERPADGRTVESTQEVFSEAERRTTHGRDEVLALVAEDLEVKKRPSWRWHCTITQADRYSHHHET